MSDSTLHTPDGKWKFDTEVGECFDDMVERSVPLYDVTLDLFARLALRHCPAGCSSTIVDLGCSNGQALARIMQATSETVATSKRMLRYIGVDREQHMLDRAHSRFGSMVELIQHDLREPLPYRIGASKPQVVLLAWTAQFVPLEHRSRLFAEVRKIIAPDGCLLIAEKVRGQAAAFQHVMTEEYADWKRRVGRYGKEQIDCKARALEGVLVSLSAPEFKQVLQAEGFAVEEVTRYLGFGSWYAIPR